MTVSKMSLPRENRQPTQSAQAQPRAAHTPLVLWLTSGWRPFAGVLVLALLVRLPFLPAYAYLPDGTLDESDWKGWMQAIHEHGVLNVFRTSDTNYVGYHWVLWPLSAVYASFGGTYGHGAGGALHFLVKAPMLLFDLGLVGAVYAVTRLLAGEDPAAARANPTRLALIAGVVIALQPAAIYDSAVWPNTDSLVTIAMLAAVVLAFRGRMGLAGAAWTFGFLMKPQPVVVLPLLVLLAVRRGGVRALLEAGAAGAVVGLVVTGPWLLHGDLIRILKVYRLLFHDRAPQLSWEAWNLWRFWDAGPRPAADDPELFFATYRMVGIALSAAAAAIALAYAWARPDLRGALIAAAYLAFAFYLLPVTTHERYLFPFLGLLLPVAIVEQRWLRLYVPVSAMFFFNLVGAAPPVKSWDGFHYANPEFLAGAGINILLFLAFTGAIAPRAWIVVERARGRLAGGAAGAPA
jgi:dolichyl-phosphate-mannose-protein mannosyltransferase